jgi:hypothetical protein
VLTHHFHHPITMTRKRKGSQVSKVSKRQKTQVQGSGLDPEESEPEVQIVDAPLTANTTSKPSAPAAKDRAFVADLLTKKQDLVDDDIEEQDRKILGTSVAESSSKSYYLRRH